MSRPTTFFCVVCGVFLFIYVFEWKMAGRAWGRGGWGNRGCRANAWGCDHECGVGFRGRGFRQRKTRGFLPTYPHGPWRCRHRQVIGRRLRPGFSHLPVLYLSPRCRMPQSREGAVTRYYRYIYIHATRHATVQLQLNL